MHFWFESSQVCNMLGFKIVIWAIFFFSCRGGNQAQLSFWTNAVNNGLRDAYQGSKKAFAICQARAHLPIQVSLITFGGFLHITIIAIVTISFWSELSKYLNNCFFASSNCQTNKGWESVACHPLVFFILGETLEDHCSHLHILITLAHNLLNRFWWHFKSTWDVQSRISLKHKFLQGKGIFETAIYKMTRFIM